MMSMLRTAATMLLFSTISLLQNSARAPKTCDQPVAVSDSKYVPGQVWTIQGRSFEPAARLTILKVESLPKLGVIVHVRIDGIRLRNCSGGPEPNVIQHAPFTRDAMERSVVKLMGTDAVPDYAEGYNRWLSDCGGVYTITASQAVAVDEKTFNSGSGCSF